MKTFVSESARAGTRWAVRLGAVAVLAAVPGLAASPPAHAGTVGVAHVSGSTLEFFSTGSVRNVVTITSNGAAYIVDDILPIAAGDGCSQVDQTKVKCSGSIGVVQVWTYGGNDEINARMSGTVNTLLKGGDGDDLLYGYDGDDRMDGGNGADTLDGFAGHDIIDGGDGNDRIQGDPGNDIINGGHGHDDIAGMEGDDTIDAGAGDDVVFGMDGRDTVSGKGGDDLLVGGGEDDALDGRAGINELDGGTHTILGDLCRNGTWTTRCERF